MLTFRYSHWDGSQQVFDPDRDDLMEALADDLMEHGDINRALRDMLRRGMQMPDGQRLDGLRDLMERLRRQRQEQLQRYNLDNTMESLREKLEGRPRHRAPGHGPPPAGDGGAARRARRGPPRRTSSSRTCAGRSSAIRSRWTRCRRASAAPSAS